ncbi:thioredoxin domain-containing protein 2 [Cricetulus griseus]|nr:thioredoxin domain-containing protein 2 [Cricetulus griseus]
MMCSSTVFVAYSPRNRTATIFIGAAYSRLSGMKLVDELKELLRTAGNRLVVVEFSAKWCGPCKTIGPIFQAMSLKYQNVMFANVDVDSAKELTQLCNIRAVPTFQMFKHTQKIFEFHGADVKTLELKIQELIHHHVAHASSRKSVQLFFDALDRDDIQIFGACVISTVDHSSYQKTQGNPEFCSRGPTMSSTRHLGRL